MQSSSRSILSNGEVDTHDMIVDDHDGTEQDTKLLMTNKKMKNLQPVKKYDGGGQQMAKDIVTYFLLRFFFQDVKDKKKIFKMKDDIMKDLNFNLVNGKVARAT